MAPAGKSDTSAWEDIVPTATDAGVGEDEEEEEGEEAAEKAVAAAVAAVGLAAEEASEGSVLIAFSSEWTCEHRQSEAETDTS